MKKPDMILFDSGGTLCIDTDYDMLRATKAIMPYLAGNPRGVTAEELHATMQRILAEIRPMRREGIEIGEWTIMRRACAENAIAFDLDEHTFESIFRIALTPVERTPYIGDLLDYLKESDIRTGVVSNSLYSGVSLRERHSRLFPGNRFECFVSSCDFGVRKPNRALFDIALAQTGVSAENAWYCGDDDRFDVVGAHNAGMFPVLYDNERAPGEAALLDAQENGDDFKYLCVSDWRELITLLEKIDE